MYYLLNENEKDRLVIYEQEWLRKYGIDARSDVNAIFHLGQAYSLMAWG